MPETSGGSKSGSTTYWERVLYHRSRNKPFNNIVRHWRSGDLSFKQRLRKTYLEVALFYNGIKKIIEEIRLYGGCIRKEYGISKTRQFLQQFYLYFVIGVKWTHSFYRKYLLFKADRWKWVREFTYFNEPIEREFIVESLPGVEEYEHKHDLFRDKTQFYKHCLEHKIPTPEIFSEIKIKEQFANSELDLHLPEEDIFIKKIDGACGVGAAKFYYHKNGYEDIHGNSCTTEDILKLLNNGESGASTYVVQPVVQNHEDWKPFTSGAVATCRILTGLSPVNREVITISAVLRMPTGSAIADNFAAGGLVSPIDMETGELGTAVCYKPQKGSFEFDHHPDTGHKIKGMKLPHWKQLVAFTDSVHRTFDFIFVGWDIVYTNKGFSVIEGNGMWAGDVIESPHNLPLSKTKYPELFDRWMEHFRSRANWNRS